MATLDDMVFHIEAAEALSALKIMNASLNLIVALKGRSGEEMPLFVTVDSAPLEAGYNLTVKPSPWLSGILDEYKKAVA